MADSQNSGKQPSIIDKLIGALSSKKKPEELEQSKDEQTAAKILASAQRATKAVLGDPTRDRTELAQHLKSNSEHFSSNHQIPHFISSPSSYAISTINLMLRISLLKKLMCKSRSPNSFVLRAKLSQVSSTIRVLIDAS